MRIFVQSLFLVISSLLASVLLPQSQSTAPSLQFIASKLAAPALAAPAMQETQDAELFLDELEIIYLTNLERRENNLPPLRWNRELHLAARWFAQDAIIGRPTVYCGHEDSLGRTPGDRFKYFGYRNVHQWGENVICGMTTPANAIKGWMNSEGHRRNVLSPDYREIGVGYYRNGESHRGYIAQDFSYDPRYAPVIIENEAIHINKTTVNLYIYDTASGEGFYGMGPAVEIMIANDPDFTDAVWQPYSAETTWQLEDGEGWRTVYVKTRDAMNRTTTVFDTIYLGESFPEADLVLEHACSFQPQIALESLNTDATWPEIQLSLNWQGDNEDITFQDSNHIGAKVDDPAAVGHTAHHLPILDGGGHIRYWTTNFYKDIELVAYFRLKTTDNTIDSSVIEVTAQGGGTHYGPLTIKGSDFVAPNQYQEFALPVRFNTNPDDPYLIFTFHHTGVSELYVDTITLFTASMPLAEEAEWDVPSGYHRSRGVWARFVQTEGLFSEATELEIFGANASLEIEPAVSPAPIAETTPAPQETPANPAPQPTPTPEPTKQEIIAQSHTIYLPITMR